MPELPAALTGAPAKGGLACIISASGFGGSWIGGPGEIKPFTILPIVWGVLLLKSIPGGSDASCFTVSWTFGEEVQKPAMQVLAQGSKFQAFLTIMWLLVSPSNC